MMVDDFVVIDKFSIIEDPFEREGDNIKIARDDLEI
jgi:hypothetical protein